MLRQRLADATESFSGGERDAGHQYECPERPRRKASSRIELARHARHLRRALHLRGGFRRRGEQGIGGIGAEDSCRRRRHFDRHLDPRRSHQRGVLQAESHEGAVHRPAALGNPPDLPRSLGVPGPAGAAPPEPALRRGTGASAACPACRGEGADRKAAHLSPPPGIEIEARLPWELPGTRP